MDGETGPGTDRAIGYVGVGSMGGSLVQGLIRAGEKPVVFDLDRSAVEAATDAGAEAAASLEELGSRCGLVGVVVSDDDQVRSVLGGGLLESMAPGSVVLLHSTLLPETVHWAAEAASEAGVGLVEAPVTGGAAAAAEGRLTFILSGSEADLEAVEPILSACAGRRIDAGELGNANLLKLCINLQTYVTHRAAHEAASLATALGLPLEGLKSAMEGNGQLGELTRNYLMLHELSPETLAEPDVIEMRARNIPVISKDLRHMEEVAGRCGVWIPGAGVAAQMIEDTYFIPTDYTGAKSASQQ
jgi:3-hydroxyisobutyrate dehydrogenase